MTKNIIQQMMNVILLHERETNKGQIQTNKIRIFSGTSSQANYIIQIRGKNIKLHLRVSIWVGGSDMTQQFNTFISYINSTI